MSSRGAEAGSASSQEAKVTGNEVEGAKVNVDAQSIVESYASTRSIWESASKKETPRGIGPCSKVLVEGSKRNLEPNRTSKPLSGGRLLQSTGNALSSRQPPCVTSNGSMRHADSTDELAEKENSPSNLDTEGEEGSKDTVQEEESRTSRTEIQDDDRTRHVLKSEGTGGHDYLKKTLLASEEEMEKAKKDRLKEMEAELEERKRLATEQSRLDQERCEEEARTAAAQAEQDSLAKIEAEEAERKRIAAEQARLDEERRNELGSIAAAKAEQDRRAKMEAEEAERKRLAAEQARLDQERREEEKRIAAAKAEYDRRAKLEAEEAERKRLAAEQAQLDQERREEEARIAAVKAEQDRLAKLEAEEAERKRIAAEQARLEEKRRQDEEQVAAAKAEQDIRAKLEAEEAERKQLAAEQARLDQERREEEKRIAAAKAEQDRRAKLEAEEAERKRIAAEQARLDEECRAEEAHIAAVKAEQDRLAKLEAEELERRRITAEQARLEEKRRQDEEQVAAVKAEQDIRAKLEAEEAERKQLAAEQARLDQERSEEEKRIAAAKAEQGRRAKLEAEEAERKRLAAEQARLDQERREEEERIAVARAEQDRLAKLEAEEAERKRIAAEQARLDEEYRAEEARIAAVKAEQDRLAKLEAEELERRRIAAEQASVEEKRRRDEEQVAAVKAEQDIRAKWEAEEAEWKQLAAEQTRLDQECREEEKRIAAAKAEQEGLTKLNATEEDRLEQERREVEARFAAAYAEQDCQESLRLNQQLRGSRGKLTAAAAEQDSLARLKDEDGRKSSVAEQLRLEVPRHEQTEGVAAAKTEPYRLAMLKMEADKELQRSAVDRERLAQESFTDDEHKKKSDAVEDERKRVAAEHALLDQNGCKEAAQAALVTAKHQLLHANHEQGAAIATAKGFQRAGEGQSEKEPMKENLVEDPIVSSNIEGRFVSSKSDGHRESPIPFDEVSGIKATRSSVDLSIDESESMDEVKDDVIRVPSSGRSIASDAEMTVKFGNSAKNALDEVSGIKTTHSSVDLSTDESEPIDEVKDDVVQPRSQRAPSSGRSTASDAEMTVKVRNSAKNALDEVSGIKTTRSSVDLSTDESEPMDEVKDDVVQPRSQRVPSSGRSTASDAEMTVKVRNSAKNALHDGKIEIAFENNKLFWEDVAQIASSNPPDGLKMDPMQPLSPGSGGQVTNGSKAHKPADAQEMEQVLGGEPELDGDITIFAKGHERAESNDPSKASEIISLGLGKKAEDTSFAPPLPHMSDKASLRGFDRDASLVHVMPECKNAPDVRSSGSILTRLSLKSLFLRKWKESYWAQYGPTALVIFRSKEEFNDWQQSAECELFSSDTQRDFLVKFHVDFAKELSKPGVRGYKLTEVKRKSYGQDSPILHQFKLQRWMDLGPSIAAAFASESKEDITKLHSAISECLQRCPENGLRSIQDLLVDDSQNQKKSARFLLG